MSIFGTDSDKERYTNRDIPHINRLIEQLKGIKMDYLLLSDFAIKPEYVVKQNDIFNRNILERSLNLITLSIFSRLHASKHSVSMVCSRATAKGLTQQRMVEMSDMDVYTLLFPEKEASNTLYAEVDYDYVTSELRRTGVTMKLLHEEYVDKCRTDGSLPVGYTKFCTDYKTWRASRDYSYRIIHKPGMSIEVDWSGPKMHYIDRQTQTEVVINLP